MRDRFPLALVSGLLLLGVVGSFVLGGARRAEFADRLSTFKSAPDGARGLYLLVEGDRLPVTRNQKSFDIIDPGLNLALLGVRFRNDADPEQNTDQFDGADAGVEEDDDATAFERVQRELRSPPIDKEETEKLLEHIRNGATVVYVPGTFRQTPLLDAVGVELIRAEKQLDVRSLVPAQPSPWTLGVERVECKVVAYIDEASDGTPLLLDDKLDLQAMALYRYGQGQLVVLTAPELAMNRVLAKADNAQLWRAVVRTASLSGTLAFDEFHHGFSSDRSIAEFATRYGLQFAAAQLLLGVMLWAGSLRRFGRPRPPPEEARLTSTDALSATSRIYREGRHHAHAAHAIAAQLAQELAQRAGLPPKATPSEISAALDFRGRKDLAAAVLEVARAATRAHTESDVTAVAALAALARQRLTAPSRRPT